MFSGTSHAGLFSAKKDDKKPPASNPSGLFSGLGIKGKAAAKDPPADYTPPSVPTPPAKSDVYTPPILPSQRLPLQVEPQGATDYPALPMNRDSPQMEPASRTPEFEASTPPADPPKPKSSGLFASMKSKTPSQAEEAKVVHSRKNEFSMEAAAKQPESRTGGGLLSEMRTRPDTEIFAPQPRDEDSFAPSRAAIEGKKLLEKSRRDKEDREEKDRIERERRAAEEKDRQRYQSPDLLIAWVEERLASYAKQLEEKNKKQMELVAEAAKLQEKLGNLQVRKTQTMERQEQAAAEEDYEQAEKLNQVIKDMELVTIQTSTEIAKNTSLYQSYESDKTEIYTSQKKFLGEVQIKASDRKAAEENELTKYKAEKSQLKSSQETKFTDETQRLAEEKARLESEESLLAVEKEETETRISQHTHELQEEKDTAETELVTILSEIEELERTLALKKTQRQLLQNTIEACEEQIKERMAAFQDEIMVVELKVNKLEQAKAKAERETENLENAHADFVIQHENAEKEAEAWEQRNRRLQTCLEDLKSRQERLERLAAVRETYLARIEENTKLLKVKQEELQETEEYARTVKDADEEIRHKFVQKRDRLSELEMKIPKLEAEKKAFASAKQYKDAARLANEVKTAITERESLLEDIEKVRSSMTEQDQHSAEVRPTQIDRGALELRTELEKLQKELTEAREGLMGQGQDQASLE